MFFVKNAFTYLQQLGERALFVFGLSFFFVTPTVAYECGKEPRTVTVSLLIFSTAQRAAFEEVAENFSSQCPNILIDYLSSDDEDTSSSRKIGLKIILM